MIHNHGYQPPISSFYNYFVRLNFSSSYVTCKFYAVYKDCVGRYLHFARLLEKCTGDYNLYISFMFCAIPKTEQTNNSFIHSFISSKFYY